jgi:hypothetical protein
MTERDIILINGVPVESFGYGYCYKGDGLPDNYATLTREEWQELINDWNDRGAGALAKNCQRVARSLGHDFNPVYPVDPLNDIERREGCIDYREREVR